MRIKADQIPAVPSSIYKQGAFDFEPQTFAPDSVKLNTKFMEASVQIRSLEMFKENPSLRMIYGVSGNPHDSKAKYFAAYLCGIHYKKVKQSNIIWYPLYSGFKTSLLDRVMNGEASKPSMLVISNLTPNSTQYRLEKARDIIEYFNDIPRIVVCAGEDPMSFLATRLFVPINGVFYTSESLVKQRVEVI